MEARALIRSNDGSDDDTAAAEPTDSCIYGTFVVAGREVTLPAHDVREVVPFPEGITRLPLVPPYVLGVFSLRGEVLPVIDVARLLGLDTRDPVPGQARVAVVDCGTHHVGALFEATGEVLEVPDEQLQPLKHRPDLPERIVSGLLSLEGGARLVQVLSAELIAHVERIPRGERRRDDVERIQPTTKLVFVEVAGTTMAIRVERVLEIQRSLPLAMEVAWFEGCVGVVELRGDSVAVMSLGTWLGGPEKPLDEGRMVFVSDGTSVCALHVDAICRVFDVPDEDFVHVPMLDLFDVGSCIDQVVRGVGGDALVLDIPRLFAAVSIEGSMPDGSGKTLLEYGEDIEVSEDVTYLGVSLGHQVFGLDMASVREIRDFPDTILKHPAADQSFLGLMNLRGIVIPVVDLRPRYGLRHDQTAGRKVVIVDVEGRPHGVVVDELRGIFHDTDGQRTDALLALNSGGRSPEYKDHVTGILNLHKRVGGGGVMLLDIEAALGGEEIETEQAPPKLVPLQLTPNLIEPLDGEE